MARNKIQEPVKDNSERWLLTYSDLITLLMIFFVVMYAISNVDAKKYEVLSESLVGALNPTSLQVGVTGSGISADTLAQALANDENSDIDPRLIAAAEEIQQLLKEKGLEDKVSVSVQERGVVVGLLNTILFESGSANIKEDAIPTLIAIGHVAHDVNNYIRIEGNTDDVPQNSAQFPSNWELASSRANEVLKLMIDQSGVQPSKISSVSYGEHRPTVPNTSSENRARNRKVDIVILSNKLDKSESESADFNATPSGAESESEN